MGATVNKIDALEELMIGGNITPTLVYNEGWMLRLVLNWLSENRHFEHEISFSEGARWFSEASLPTIFKAKNQKDKLAENYTHADGVYGSIQPYDGKDYIKLEKNCNQFVVVEAKMFSSYSPGVIHAPSYNQAARIVACMCEVLKLQGFNVNGFSKLAFFTFLPESQIKDRPSFLKYTCKKNIKEKVENRIKQYSDAGRTEEYEEKAKWYEEFCCPFIDNIQIELISWESILNFVSLHDEETYKKLMVFYDKCKKYNR